MAMPNPRRLLVEGKEDLRIIPEFVEKNGVAWGPKNRPIVEIKDCGGFNGVIGPHVIETELKASGLSAMGIIVDADDDCAARWQAIRGRCVSEFPSLPPDLPEEGVVAFNKEGGIRLGVWIMPDNGSPGMIETFLLNQVPASGIRLRKFAEDCVSGSRNQGAQWKDAHKDKACIHTWLAWQDPPGCQLHTAVLVQQLVPDSPSANAFMTWFRNLYQI